MFFLVLFFISSSFSSLTDGCFLFNSDKRIACVNFTQHTAQNSWNGLRCDIFLISDPIDLDSCAPMSFRQLDLAFNMVSDLYSFFQRRRSTLEQFLRRFNQTETHDRYLTIHLKNTFEAETVNLTVDETLVRKCFPTAELYVTRLTFNITVETWTKTHVLIYSNIRDMLPKFTLEILLHRRNERCSISMMNSAASPGSQIHTGHCRGTIIFVNSSESIVFLSPR